MTLNRTTFLSGCRENLRITSTVTLNPEPLSLHLSLLDSCSRYVSQTFSIPNRNKSRIIKAVIKRHNQLVLLALYIES